MTREIQTRIEKAEIESASTSNSFVFDTESDIVASVQAVARTSWGTTVVTVKRSNDKDNLVNLEETVTLSADGISRIIDVTGFKWLGVAVSTVDVSASAPYVIDFTLCFKRELDA